MPDASTHNAPMPNALMPTRPPHRIQGLTLIELMIVGVILSILASLAYPSYQTHVLRTHRARAAACLEELSLLMERQFSVSLAYNTTTTLPSSACVSSLSDRYDLGFAPNEPTAQTYVLRATPKGAQAGDTTCGTLGLNHQGTRTAAPPPAQAPAPAPGTTPGTTPAPAPATGTTNPVSQAVVQSCWR